jgi:putative iron-only hydrogenase system regulator
METRVAVIAIIVSDTEQYKPINDLLHDHARYIIGRMGIPYHVKGISIISVAVDAPQSATSALSGKLGRLPNVSVKTVYAGE